MTKVIRNSATLAVLTATAFANPAAAPAATGAAPVKGKPGAKPGAERVAPEFTPVSTAFALPAAKSGRGQKSELAKQLEVLEVGQSVGLKNKSKKQISSTLSKINNAESNLSQKTDANGNKLFKNGDAIKDAAGNVVSYQQVPDMVQVKEFVAHDRTAADKDEPGVTVRIWRTR